MISSVIDPLSNTLSAFGFPSLARHCASLNPLVTINDDGIIFRLRPPSSVRKLQRRVRAASHSSKGEAMAAERTDVPKDMEWMRILDEGVYRFDIDEDARNAAFPSFSFAAPSLRETPLDNENISTEKPAYIPTCSYSNGKQTVILEFASGTSFYGTGEVSGSLERTGKRVFAWNTDAWGYGPSTTSLYQSHPWIVAVFPDGRVFGVLADSTQRCEVDLRKGPVLMLVAAYSYPVITFGPYSSPKILFNIFSKAIGTFSMPPKWAVGYHQCRWSYEPASRVLEVARTFREKRIPCDVVWMDIDYMDGFRCFTFDPENFRDPQSLTRDLHSEGFKAVWMLDPGIKSEEGYSVYDSGCAHDVWVLNKDGKPFVGEVWPGPCVFPDYTSAKARNWWAELVNNFMSKGIDGIWNDMNEPTVFKTVTKTMPLSNVHRGDVQLGERQSHLHYHNVYGMLMARSTYEGMLLADSQRRPFVLTRAGYIGSQRYAATWTGDNLATWDHLRMSIPMVLNLGLSGQPFSGPDIGGFAGDATPKLFARWMGIGTLLPFARAHSEKGSIDHEPWAFGIECENVCRLAITRRYILLPHLYTLFYTSHVTGMPVAQPLFFADPKDPKLRKVEDSFLLGAVLVSARGVSDAGGSHSEEIIFPHGTWNRFNFDDDHPDLPLLYLKGGSIIPVGPAVQHSGEINASATVTLLVSLDESGMASGQFYEDEGDGFSYTHGKFLLTTYQAKLENDVVILSVSESEGSMERPRRMLNLHLLIGETAMLRATAFDGQDVRLNLPSESKRAELIADTRQKQLERMKHVVTVPYESEYHDGRKGEAVPSTLIELKGGDWQLKVVPWIGGRIISMIHAPTGIEWLWSRIEMSGYEEYSEIEYRSPGCVEEYNILKRKLLETEGEEAIVMEADVGGGVAIQREIFISKDNPQVLQIHSQIIAKAVGAGGGGFSRLVCLRVHPTFQLRHPMETFVQFTAINGTTYEVNSDTVEVYFEGDERPNGEWLLVDKCAKIALVNRFKVEEVEKCVVCWGPGTCNLEIWSKERPVSKDNLIVIHHEYETVEY